MKKTLCVLSVLVLLMSFGTACGKNKTDIAETTTQTTTEFKFTEVDGVISHRVDIDDNNYEMYYIDENGNAIKTEYYANDKLVYYYTISGTDEYGNGNQNKYYDAKGNLFAVCDKGYYYDAKGKQITEETMDSIISKLK